MRGLVKDLRLNFLVVSETKLDESFPLQQFVVEDFEIRVRKNRDRYGGGYVRKCFIYERLNYLESKSLEYICSKLTSSNKKWICYSVYRPPSLQNLEVFFNKLTDSLSKANEKYKNFIVMGDFNIDIDLTYGDHDKLEEFCTLFNFQSLINKDICLLIIVIRLLLTNGILFKIAVLLK